MGVIKGDTRSLDYSSSHGQRTGQDAASWGSLGNPMLCREESRAGSKKKRGWILLQTWLQGLGYSELVEV